AVIGSFVLGLGNSVQQTAPNANFQFEYYSDAGKANATHTGGATISADATIKIVSESNSTGVTFNGGEMSAGDSFREGVTYNSDESVRVIWESENGETSQTLAEETAP
uniref:type IV pilin N-terminal domain-containing protein n=1 Tax=Halobaculum sp. EA56 TaxID=3421648 RepID=UPI003EBAF477